MARILRRTADHKLENEACMIRLRLRSFAWNIFRIIRTGLAWNIRLSLLAFRKTRGTFQMGHKTFMYILAKGDMCDSHMQN